MAISFATEMIRVSPAESLCGCENLLPKDSTWGDVSPAKPLSSQGEKYTFSIPEKNGFIGGVLWFFLKKPNETTFFRNENQHAPPMEPPRSPITFLLIFSHEK